MTNDRDALTARLKAKAERAGGIASDEELWEGVKLMLHALPPDANIGALIDMWVKAIVKLGADVNAPDSFLAELAESVRAKLEELAQEVRDESETMKRQ